MIHNRIQQAAMAANRDFSEIQLIGACKQQASKVLAAFHNAGLTQFGENYLQEALAKQTELPTNIDWHFIGKLQSNKCKDIAQHFDWVHTVDRLKIAQRLAKSRLADENLTKPLNVLIQLNPEQENTKSGVSLSEAGTLSAQISELNGLALRGFMLIPAPKTNTEEQRLPFAQARETLEMVNQRYGITLDTLSMGMSNDLETAILEGATMIRVGTALFGSRT